MSSSRSTLQKLESWGRKHQADINDDREARLCYHDGHHASSRAEWHEYPTLPDQGYLEGHYREAIETSGISEARVKAAYALIAIVGLARQHGEDLVLRIDD